MRIAYTALHYGISYLAWALRSVEHAVDEIHILYAQEPSFGHKTTAACPESEADLRKEAGRFVTKPIIWHRGRWPSEGAQRDSIFGIALERGADQVLWVDADEIWEKTSVERALAEAAARPERIFRVRFVHFWRSFKWVAQDGAWPLRVINVRRPPAGDGYIASQVWPVFHFGYAQPEAIMRYKWQIHGHLGELRKRWLEEKFLGWKPGDLDVHPTCERGYWNPKPTEPEMLAVLSGLVGDHPWWDKDVIP